MASARAGPRRRPARTAASRDDRGGDADEDEDEGAGRGDAGQQQGLVSRLREVLLTAEEQTYSIQTKERRLAEQTEALEASRHESRELRAERDQLQTQVAELQSFAEKQQEHICKLQKGAQEAKKVRSGYEASLRGLEQRVSELEEQALAKDSAQNTLQTELERSRLEGLAAAERVRETEAILAQVKQTNERRTNELRKRCVSLQTSASASEVEVERLKSEVAALRVAKQDALEEIRVLKEADLVQQDALQRARRDASSRAGQVTELETKLSDLEVKLKAQHVLVDEAHAAQTNLEETLAKVRAKADEDEQMAAAKSQHLQNKLDALELERDQQVQSLEQALQKARNEADQASKKRAEEVSQEREAHASSVRSLTTRLNGLQRSLEQHQRLLQEARTERDDKVDALAKAASLREELSASLETQAAELAATRGREEAATQALAEASEAAKTALEEANAKAVRLREQLTSATRSSQRASEELAAKTSESAGLSQELDALRTRAQDAADRLNASLQSERDALAALRQELDAAQQERAREAHNFRERERRAASALQRAQQGAAEAALVAERKREALEADAKARAADLAAAAQEKDLLAAQLVDAKTALRQLREREKAAETKAGAAEAAGRSLQQKLRAAQEELARAAKDAAAAQQNQAERYQKLVRKLADDLETSKAHLAAAKDRCGTLEARNVQVQQTMAAQIVGLDEKARAYHQQSEGLRNEISRLKASLQVMTTKEAHATEAAAETQRDLAAKIQTLEARARQATQEKAAIDLAMSKLRQDFAAEKEALQRAVEDEQQKARDEAHKSRWKAARVEEELNSLQLEKATLADQLSRAQDENKRLADSEQGLMRLYKSMANPDGPGSSATGAPASRPKLQRLQATASSGTLRRPRPRSAAPRVSRRAAPAGGKKHKPRLDPLPRDIALPAAEDPAVNSPLSSAATLESAEETPRHEDKGATKDGDPIRSVADILRRKHHPSQPLQRAGPGPSSGDASDEDSDARAEGARTCASAKGRKQPGNGRSRAQKPPPASNQVDLSPTEVRNYLDQFLREDVEC